MTTTDYDHNQDIGYYRFAAIACSYAWTRVMREAGNDYESIIAFNGHVNKLWSDILTNYVSYLSKTPANTRAELGELELKDLVDTFNKEIAEAYAQAVETESDSIE